jgi:hypothetical protein
MSFHVDHNSLGFWLNGLILLILTFWYNFFLDSDFTILVHIYYRIWSCKRRWKFTQDFGYFWLDLVSNLTFIWNFTPVLVFYLIEIIDDCSLIYWTWSQFALEAILWVISVPNTIWHGVTCSDVWWVLLIARCPYS